MILKTIIESRIKAALQKGDLDTLNRWLIIANGGSPCSHWQSPWQFQFSNGQSLIDYAIATSNQLHHSYRAPTWKQRVWKNLTFSTYEQLYLHPSQTIFKLLIEAAIKQKNVPMEALETKGSESKMAKVAATPPPAVVLSRFQRFINAASRVMKVRFTFLGRYLRLTEITSDFKQAVVSIKPARKANTPTRSALRPSSHSGQVMIGEKYSAHQILDNADLMTKQMGLAALLPKPQLKKTTEMKSAENKSATIPAHMQHWCANEKLSIVHQIDAAQQLQHQHVQQAEIKIGNQQALEIDQDADYWVDQSENYELSLSTFDPHHDKTVHEWCRSFELKLKQLYGDGCTISVTSNARTILSRGQATMQSKRAHSIDFDLRTLPLGFFITRDKANDKHFTLRFDPKLRAQQLKDPNSRSELRLDPFAVANGDEKKQEEPESITKLTDLHAALTKRKIELNSEQLKFLAALEREDQLTSWKSARVFDAFIKIARHATHQHFSTLLDLLMAFKSRTVNFANKDLFKKSQNLLDLFLQYYLQGIAKGTEFDSDEQIQALKQLATLKDDDLRLFCAITSPGYGGNSGVAPGQNRDNRGYKPQFEKVWKALHYFTDFFASRGYDIPEQMAANLLKGGAPFIQLSAILECINLSVLPALQARYAHEIPDNFVRAANLLRSGFSFVHKSMCIKDVANHGDAGDDWIKFWVQDMARAHQNGANWVNKNYKTYAALDLKARFAYVQNESHQSGTQDFPLVIDPKELQEIQYVPRVHYFTREYTVCYRTVYLRYVAYHVAPQHVEAAIQKWEELTGTSISYEMTEKEKRVRAHEQDKTNKPVNSRLETGLETHWDQLRDYVLKLPTKLSMSAELKEDKVEATQSIAVRAKEEFVPQKVARKKQEPENVSQREVKAVGALANDEILKARMTAKKYSASDAAELFKQLKLDNKVQVKLQEYIDIINDVAQPFRDFTAEKLMTACKEAKKKVAGINEPEARKRALAQCVGLLSELHYRYTLSSSTQKPKKGEELRLEQLVTILHSLERDALFQVDTSEGKTLIISFIAILKALDGKKVDVLTHNEFLAGTAAAKLTPFALNFDLKVADKKPSPHAVIEADILYIDAATAVTNATLAQQNKDEKAELPGQRAADAVLVDEADNVVVDIHAVTTMQISEVAADKESTAKHASLEQFLLALNYIVRDRLAGNADLTKPDEQIKFVRSELDKASLSPDAQQWYANTDDLIYWMKAAVLAMKLHKEIDYVIETNHVRILHKNTTGRVDKISQWGQGVHQCIAAWEKAFADSVIIPRLSDVVAEGNVASYLNREHYKSRCGFTGTTGDENTKKYTKQVMQVDTCIEMPRAKRPAPGNATWPLVMPKLDSCVDDLKAQREKSEPVDLYNRAYRFRPFYEENKEAHFNKLLELIQTTQQQNQSCILFFNTIAECNEFNQFLACNNIRSSDIQILDDTHPDEKEEASFRPAEETVIKNAHMPRMVTLTTAAGSRGTDFDEIDVGVIVKPGLDRIRLQKAGRIGRNGKLGVVHEIYCREDLDEEAQKALAPASDKQASSTTLDSVLDAMAQRQQKVDLERIAKRKPIDDLKDKAQREFAEYRKKNPNSNTKNLSRFFKQAEKVSEVRELESVWSEFRRRYMAG